jgi:hypothetical protein
VGAGKPDDPSVLIAVAEVLSAAEDAGADVSPAAGFSTKDRKPLETLYRKQIEAEAITSPSPGQLASSAMVNFDRREKHSTIAR